MKIDGDNIREWLFRVSLLALIMTAIGFIIQDCRVTKLELENEILLSDKTALELELNDLYNEMYALNLELRSTEKTLADTAFELENLTAQDTLNLRYVGEYNCTAYCTEKYPHICGGGGNTASGVPVVSNVSVAVTDLETLPYGTVIYIEGVGIRIVQDTGGFSKNLIDVAVETHEEALHWKGSGKHKVWIVESEKGE